MDFDDELVDFLESGVSITVGARDDHLVPSCAWAMGARVDRGAGTVTVFVPEATSARVIEGARANGAVAITFSRPVDHRTMQLKGAAMRVEPAATEDRQLVERYRAAFMEHLRCVGWPRAAVRRIAFWPAVALEVRVAELFEQTPGPRAGTRIAS